MSTYDDWKLATPPEYESDEGPEEHDPPCPFEAGCTVCDLSCAVSDSNDRFCSLYVSTSARSWVAVAKCSDDDKSCKTAQHLVRQSQEVTMPRLYSEMSKAEQAKVDAQEDERERRKSFHLDPEPGTYAATARAMSGLFPDFDWDVWKDEMKDREDF